MFGNSCFEAEYPEEENHGQAVGGGHGPGKPEHLVLLAILHNPSWFSSTGSRQGARSWYRRSYLLISARCSELGTTFQDLWDNTHCWWRSPRCRRRGNSVRGKIILFLTHPTLKMIWMSVRRKIVLEGDNFLSPKITAVFSQVSFCHILSTHPIVLQRKEKSVLSIEMAFRRRYFSSNASVIHWRIVIVWLDGHQDSSDYICKLQVSLNLPIFTV